jgi:hypothetical protein
MVANVYVLRDDSETPSGWTEIGASYRDKLIKGNGTPLATGGTDTHQHTTLDSWSCGYAGVSGSETHSGSAFSRADGGRIHTHGYGTLSCTLENHIPPYKNFRLLYRSLTGWNYTVPSGSILFKASTHSKYDRYDNGQSYFIRIASTAGGTGGATSHTHVASGNTGSQDPNYACGVVDGVAITLASSTHTHSYSFTSSSSTISFSSWACGLVKSNVLTTVVKDLYMFFDDTPTSMFEVVSGADDMFLKVSADNSVTIESHSSAHTHTCSGNTGYPNETGNPDDTYTGYYATVYAHVHSVSFTLHTVTPEPSYVRLKLAKVLVDIVNSVIITVI